MFYLCIPYFYLYYITWYILFTFYIRLEICLSLLLYISINFISFLLELSFYCSMSPLFLFLLNFFLYFIRFLHSSRNLSLVGILLVYFY
jgi:hypothetical protein